MKRIVILATVAALCVAMMTGTALAKQKGKNRATFNFKGTLQEVAVDGSYVVVDVTGGNKRARQHLGVQQFAVTSDTKVEVNEEKVDLSELPVGEQVKVQSKAAKNAQTFSARKISAETSEVEPEPQPEPAPETEPQPAA